MKNRLAFALPLALAVTPQDWNLDLVTYHHLPGPHDQKIKDSLAVALILALAVALIPELAVALILALAVALILALAVTTQEDNLGLAQDQYVGLARDPFPGHQGHKFNQNFMTDHHLPNSSPSGQDRVTNSDPPLSSLMGQKDPFNCRPLGYCRP